MKKEDFDLLRRSVEQMVAFESGQPVHPARQTTYVGKVLTEVKVNGETVWSLVDAANTLKEKLTERHPTSYGDLIRAMIEILGQSDEGFAQLMGVPTGTIRGWKSGRREPQGASRKLLAITIHNPGAVFAEKEDRFAFV